MTASEIRSSVILLKTEVTEGSYSVPPGGGIYGNFFTSTGGSLEALWKKKFCPGRNICDSVKGWCSIARAISSHNSGRSCDLILRDWKGKSNWKSLWISVLESQRLDAAACEAAIKE